LYSTLIPHAALPRAQPPQDPAKRAERCASEGAPSSGPLEIVHVPGHVLDSRTYVFRRTGPPGALIALNNDIWNPHQVRGFVTERGSKFSHSSILARSMRTPAVAGVADAPRVIKTGDQIIVDGMSGLVFVNPEPSVQTEYKRLDLAKAVICVP
jgi:hypothetical protein